MSDEINKERFKLIKFFRELGNFLGNVLTSDEDVIRPIEDVLVREVAKPGPDGNIPVDKMTLADVAKLLQKLREADAEAAKMHKLQINGSSSRGSNRAAEPRVPNVNKEKIGDKDKPREDLDRVKSLDD